ncbi:MAG: pyruvate, phosphate dikinase [SAR202 cluster bacterium]|nr:pyruvate, phosphate dikinase [SAR202 cluster bacterium]
MTTSSVGKMIYRLSEGGASMVNLLGGKGAHASEMARIGIPVPPGFVITTATSLEYFRLDHEFPAGLWEDIVQHIRVLEEDTGRKFGDPEIPLVVSVRSGAPVSMPGMMDTILNMGVVDSTVAGLARMMGNERPALDAQRRLIQGFGDVVLGVAKSRFESTLEKKKTELGVEFDYELTPDALKELINEFKKIIKEDTGEDLSSDPWELLRASVQAVFDSWNNPRAITYRDFQGISHDVGTACVIMAMVFGNLGEDSGTGVLFSRSPATGEKTLYGEFLPNAQGEDVVAGIRTPFRIESLQQTWPQIFHEIEETARTLEEHYKDVQDIEFTIERGKLYILQTRAAKRTAPAAVRIGVELVHEGVISRDQALGRIEASEVSAVMMPHFDPNEKKNSINEGNLLAVGVGGSPGAAAGVAVMDPDRAVSLALTGETVILVRHETNPDDVHGIIKAAGVLTSRGGMTSHAAVVTRGLGKPCVVGCEELHFEQDGRSATARGKTIREGDLISIDGATGEVLIGSVPTIDPRPEDLLELNELLGWADEARRMRVWANADTPEDAIIARANGAEGIGLCRTEHMFFAEERLPHIQRLLAIGPEASSLINELSGLEQALHDAPASERASLQKKINNTQESIEKSSIVSEFHAELSKLENFQTEDFYGIFKAMEGFPVVIRLLDAPLHEFLPSYESLLHQVSDLKRRLEGEGKASDWVARGRALLGEAANELMTIEAGERIVDWLAEHADHVDVVSEKKLLRMLSEREEMLELVEKLHESNPMLGHRGCRVGLTMPEIYEMQVRAIITAACRLVEEGVVVSPEIMIPIVSHVNELKWLRPRLRSVASETRESLGVKMTYLFGTMIEVPRAALTAGEIAEETEFFSFGSNDLTQMTFAFSRDDAEGKFLNQYVGKDILPKNPFNSLDISGVGKLMSMATEAARKFHPDFSIGICGEHGGDPASIAFCNELGLNYVSASPFRVPVARLAAAQSALGLISAS